jgi:hypothetical protein
MPNLPSTTEISRHVEEARKSGKTEASFLSYASFLKDHSRIVTLFYRNPNLIVKLREDNETLTIHLNTEEVDQARLIFADFRKSGLLSKYAHR